jgi:5'-3' exoribonuclease 1
MTDVASPIIDFYPTEFETDLNGKKADWEAIVKIPFIEENRLLKALKSREQLLTPSEKSRNSFGDSHYFHFESNSPRTYPSSLPGVFPGTSKQI